MFVYEKKLQYPVRIKNVNPKLAAQIISQYGGPKCKWLQFPTPTAATVHRHGDPCSEMRFPAGRSLPLITAIPLSRRVSGRGIVLFGSTQTQGAKTLSFLCSVGVKAAAWGQCPVLCHKQGLHPRQTLNQGQALLLAQEKASGGESVPVG